MSKSISIHETIGVISTAWLEPSIFDYKFNIFLPVYKNLKIIDLLFSNFLNLKCKTILFICSPEQFLFLKKRYKDIVMYNNILNKEKAICKIYYILNTEKDNIRGMFRNALDFTQRLNQVYKMKRKIFFFFSNNYSVLNLNLFRAHNFEMNYVNFIYRKKEDFSERKIEKNIFTFGLEDNNFICISEKYLRQINSDISNLEKDSLFMNNIVEKYVDQNSKFKFSDYNEHPVFKLSSWDDYVNLLNYANNSKEFILNSQIIGNINKNYYLPQISYDNFDYQDEFDIESINIKKLDKQNEENYHKWLQSKKRVIKLLT